MEISPRDYTMNSASRYNGRTCAKEADESLTPLRNPDCDDIEEWPSLLPGVFVPVPGVAAFPVTDFLIL